MLTAFREVEDALISYRTETARHATLAAAARDSRLAFERAGRLDRAGLTDFLRVLDSERSSYAAEDRLAQGDLAEVQQTIALFKALGGRQGVQFVGDPAPDAPGPGAVAFR